MSATEHNKPEAHEAHAKKAAPPKPDYDQAALHLQDSRGDLTPAFVHWMHENAKPHELTTRYAGRSEEFDAALKAKK
jgi:hypothetical protein